jgi:hypothetical protein
MANPHVVKKRINNPYSRASLLMREKPLKLKREYSTFYQEPLNEAKNKYLSNDYEDGPNKGKSKMNGRNKDLLTTSNPKTQKGEKKGYRTHIMHLAPANLSGNNTCPSASPGCESACLNTSGHGNSQKVQSARCSRTDFFFGDRDGFMKTLHNEIVKSIASAKRAGLTPVFRLNGTSDIRWEDITYEQPDGGIENIFDAFPGVQFYDYTKIPRRGAKPEDNYWLTFSKSETNDAYVADAMDEGQNVAVVFGFTPKEVKEGEDVLPKTWTGPGGRTWPVLDGDEDDLRFRDPERHIVGLPMRGRASKDTSGFVVYPGGLQDSDSFERLLKAAQKDKALVGDRTIDGEKFKPVQTRVSKREAERTAEKLREIGMKARVITHGAQVRGKDKTLHAVLVGGKTATAYARKTRTYHRVWIPSQRKTWRKINGIYG